jgi:hypothetical protein
MPPASESPQGLARILCTCGPGLRSGDRVVRAAGGGGARPCGPGTCGTGCGGARAKPADTYAFVTSNHRDFSVPNGDHRHPHPDLAGLFDGDRSRYVYGPEGLHDLLLKEFEDWYTELQDEADGFLDWEEPRTLAQIVEAEQEFFDRVSYVRDHVHYDEDDPDTPDDLRVRVREWRDRMEAKYGRDSLHEAIGPGHDPAWQYGYISGKLATLRWVLGSEWDFLDT